MHKHTVTLLVGALVLIAGGSMVVPQLFADEATPIVRWNQADEEDVPQEAADPAAAGEDGNPIVERSAAELPAGGAADERVELILRGRVVDKFKAGVPAATVWLDYGRGGPRGGGGGGGQANRQRRVPDPVTTDAEGRFAFQGQTFRNLRVWLQVAHDRFALGQFDKDIGQVATEVDLGDLVLMAGGELRGRVTDLEGNGIAAAELRLQPENTNPLRLLRDREKLLPVFTSDANGYFRRPHLAPGDWSVAATAKRHTEGRSSTFAVEEDQTVDIEDIRLGPGFEVTGIVRNARGEPIAKATVTMQGEARNRPGGRGGDNAAGPGGGGGQGMPFAFGGGREHRTTTDAEGRFSLEHLPGTAMRLQTEAEGYLDYRQDGVDPTLGQPIFVSMQDGLRIEGTVKDSDGTPVTLFAFRAVRLRGLPPPGQASADLNNLVNQLRSGTLDEATRSQLSAQVESLRAQLGGQGGRGGRGPGGQGGPGQDGGRGDRGPDGGPGRGGARDLGKAERHPGGTFVATGLQEGVYEVLVQSPEHARYSSAELELRSNAPVPQLAITLDAGVYVAGAVLDQAGAPVRGARVELRTPSAFEGMARGRGRNGGGGGRGEQPVGAGADFNGMAREFQRMAAGTQLTLETTTNAEGVFIVKHVPRGTYRLQAEAKSFADASTEAFELTADRSGFELRLGALGSLAGTVRGLGEKEIAEARVLAVPRPGTNGNGGGGGMGALFGRGRGGGGGSPFQNVGVQPDGSYRIDDLTPGDYLVRCWVGSTQDLMREMAPQFMNNTLPPDAAVRGGEVTRLDLTAMRPQVGSVAGTVLHNNAPATGFQVELTRQDETGAPPANTGGPGRGGRGQGGPGGFGGFGRTFQSAVASSGKFTIANVPAGTYRLRVQNNRRGGTLHEELVQVVVEATTERSIVVQTHTLRGTVTRDDGGNPAELNGRVSLLPGLTAVPENLGAFQRENPGFDARLQNGAFQFETLKPGGYLLVLTVRGRERTSQPIVVQGDQTLAIAAGKVATPTATPAPNGANGPGTPAAPRQRPGNGR